MVDKNKFSGKNCFLLAAVVYMFIVIAVKDFGAFQPIIRHSSWGPIYSWKVFIGLDNYLYSFRVYLLNFIMMLPLGILLYGYLRNALYVILIAIIFSFGIELMQPVLDVGVFDIVSVIHMIVGAAGGSIAFRIISKALNKF